MGTYDDSKIRIARTAKWCDCGCGGVIHRGERYLDYKLGQRWSVPVKLECVQREPGKWYCAVVKAGVSIQ